MMTAFKVIQLFVIFICFFGSIGENDERTNQSCRDLFKASGILFLVSEIITQIMKIIN